MKKIQVWCVWLCVIDVVERRRPKAMLKWNLIDFIRPIPIGCCEYEDFMAKKTFIYSIGGKNFWWWWLFDGDHSKNLDELDCRIVIDILPKYIVDGWISIVAQYRFCCCWLTIFFIFGSSYIRPRCIFRIFKLPSICDILGLTNWIIWWWWIIFPF